LAGVKQTQSVAQNEFASAGIKRANHQTQWIIEIMIHRTLSTTLKKRFNNRNAIVLLGPRSV
jgi:hypothetical protein